MWDARYERIEDTPPPRRGACSTAIVRAGFYLAGALRILHTMYVTTGRRSRNGLTTCRCAVNSRFSVHVREACPWANCMLSIVHVHRSANSCAHFGRRSRLGPWSSQTSPLFFRFDRNSLSAWVVHTAEALTALSPCRLAAATAAQNADVPMMIWRRTVWSRRRRALPAASGSPTPPCAPTLGVDEMLTSDRNADVQLFRRRRRKRAPGLRANLTDRRRRHFCASRTPCRPLSAEAEQSGGRLQAPR